MGRKIRTGALLILVLVMIYTQQAVIYAQNEAEKNMKKTTESENSDGTNGEDKEQEKPGGEEGDKEPEKPGGKEGADLIDPSETTEITYSDGSAPEEVYSFDVPVPTLDDEFDLALIGTKGKWYDHKVSVSNPELVQ